MSRLILTVGLPRSGKTTWARASGYPVVSPDALRLTLTGQAFWEPAEPVVWAVAHIMVKALFLAGHEVVVLDACNVSRKRRDEWESDAAVPWTVEHIVFDRSAEECKAQAIADGRPELLPIIDRMAAAWEPPGWLGAIKGRP